MRRRTHNFEFTVRAKKKIGGQYFYFCGYIFLDYLPDAVELRGRLTSVVAWNKA
jgi:hypothetical protein